MPLNFTVILPQQHSSTGEETHEEFLIAATAASDVRLFARAAHAQQKVRINLANAFPNSLTLIGEAPGKLSQKLKRLSAGTIDLRVNEPGALVPALQAIQATGQGSVDAAWSNAGFFAGTDSAFNMFATVPFGPGIPEYMAWIYHGGGLQLSREMFGKHGIHNIPCAIIPPEASGWFRKEIKSPQDLKGLKMRFFGLGAKVDGQARRVDPAARARRHLPGAAARHHRRHRVLAAGDGPEARLLPGGEVLLLPRLAPAGHLPRVLHQPEEVGRRSPTSTRR